MGDKGIFDLNWILKVLIGLVLTLCLSVSSYSYMIILPRLADNIISNDNKYMGEINSANIRIERLATQYDSIKEDLIEIKNLLKRKLP